MAPVSWRESVAGMRAVVSPPASRFITSASPSSGVVTERPISQPATSPSMTKAKPTQAMIHWVWARDKASAFAAASALFCAAAMSLSASGSTLSVSWLISVSSGSMLSVLATHWANV